MLMTFKITAVVPVAVLSLGLCAYLLPQRLT